MKVKYITFATSNWSHFKFRLLNEFNVVGKELNIFNEHDIEDDHFQNFILKQKCVNRGFHNYIWKPYLIYQELMKLPEDIDILMYFDAGCDFKNNGELFKEVDKILNEYYLSDSKFMCLHSAGCSIRKICTKEFKIKHKIKNDFLDNFKHYQAGCICVKNNDWSKSFIKEYKTLMTEDYPVICEKSHRGTPGTCNNGGDQIYMQYLLYKYKITPMCMTNRIVRRMHG